MNKHDFDRLKEGENVWFAPHYFAFPMLGVIRTINGEKGVWINFFGDGQAHFIPRLDSSYESVTRYEKNGQPPLNEHKIETIFAITPHRADEGYVFVEREFTDPEGEKDKWWEKIRKDDVQEGDVVIPCAIHDCKEPAAQLDHFHPYEVRETRCKKHKRSYIDEKCYHEHGIAVLCCKEHHEMQELRDELEGRIEWLLSQHDEQSLDLLTTLASVHSDLCKYMMRKWKHELISCQF